MYAGKYLEDRRTLEDYGIKTDANWIQKFGVTTFHMTKSGEEMRSDLRFTPVSAPKDPALEAKCCELEKCIHNKD